MTADTSGAQSRNLRVVELTPRQLALLLEYGYPFPDEAQALRDSKAVKGVHRVSIGAHWIEIMSADLVRSAKKIPARNRALLEELDDLCSVLEFALVRDRYVPLR
jgi:hypothetical protein